jgi:UPF0716 protein FxsA
MLLLLFIVVPALELILLIEVGSRIGTVATLGLIVLTGVVGASLARVQGFLVLRKIQEDVARGQLPAGSLVDGLIILVAGVLLITPGILTDVFGFLCLFPAFRSVLKAMVWRRLERMVRESRVHLSVHGPGFTGQSSVEESGPVYDVEAEPCEPGTPFKNAKKRFPME